MGKTLYTPQNLALISMLKKVRIDKGVTQIELSYKIDKTQSYVAKYENNERALKIIEFLQICEAPEIDPVEIINAIKNI
ncbi:helix-turn-helix domain-containing protein [Pasteurella multocida]